MNLGDNEILVPAESGLELLVHIEHVGEKDVPWDDGRGSSDQHHVITLATSKDDFKKEAELDFWASMRDPYVENKEGAKDALECVLLDAISYLNASSYEDFCSEFGYEPYDYDGDYEEDGEAPRGKDGDRAYEGCKENTQKLLDIGLTEDDIYDMSNKMEEFVVDSND